MFTETIATREGHGCYKERLWKDVQIDLKAISGFSFFFC